jgi:hypothetical protein
MKLKVIGFTLLLMAVAILPARAQEGTFSTADLSGTWFISAVAYGPVNGRTYTGYGVITIDDQGVVTAGYYKFCSACDNSDIVGVSFVVSADGVVSIPSGFGQIPAQSSVLEGRMTGDRNTVLLFATWIGDQEGTLVGVEGQWRLDRL